MPKETGLPAVDDIRALLHATPTTHNFFNSSSTSHLHDEKTVLYFIYKKKLESFTYYLQILTIKSRQKRYFEICRILHCSKWIFNCIKCSLKSSEIVFFLWIVNVQPKKLKLSYFLKETLYYNHYGWCLRKCISLHNWNIRPIIMFHYFDW